MNKSHFQQLIWEFYEHHGRHDLPWRTPSHKATEHKTDLDPYAIYVSEIMLQQTQAPRVIDKYETWLADFPSFQAVATASKKEILSHWQGLGYNRRALYIKETAEIITNSFNDKLPSEKEKLLELPGIGPYTAGALQAFVFAKPVIFVETNIRTVFIHHFFADEEDISEAAIKELVADTLPEKRIKEWYWALMDYGAHLKKTVGNLNTQSSSYQKQSKFAGSNRQLRAELTRFILNNEPVTLSDVRNEFSELVEQNERMQSLQTNLQTLQEEGFVTNTGGRYKTSD